MTAEEESAFHKGKLAAFADAKPHQPGDTRRCPFRRPALVAKWREGYDWQVAAMAPQITEEDRARVAALSAAITEWLKRN